MPITARTLSALLLCCAMALVIGACDSSGSGSGDDDSEPRVAREVEDDGAAIQDEAEDEQAPSSPGDSAEPAAQEPDQDEQDGSDASPADDEQGGQDAVLEFVAAVNGEGLLLEEYRRQAVDTQRYFVERGLDPGTEEGQAELLALRRGVLLDMIHQELIEQAAEEMSITASDDEVAASLAEFEEELSATLDETDVSAEDVAEMERKAIIGRKFVDRIAEDVPTEAPYYRARHILCTERGPCEAALTRLEAGEEFDVVAAEVSQDETTADRGGDLDWIPRLDGINVLPSAELEAALFALEPGERSPVIESDFGYHVVELVEVDEARPLDEEQAFQLRQRRVETWLADAVRRADIVIYPEDLQDVIAAR